MKAWWHRLRWVSCAMCGTEFRKGKGGGVSRRTVCSDECWVDAWRDWLQRTSGKRPSAGRRAP